MEPFQAPDASSDPQPGAGAVSEVLVGVGVVLATDAVVLSASGLSGDLFVIVGMTLGATQFLWLTPIAVLLTRNNRRLAAQAALVFAACLFLLQAACYGIVLGGANF